MGLCEKCDDRASGRLDCDLTSEGGGGHCARERKRKVRRERAWVERNEERQEKERQEE